MERIAANSTRLRSVGYDLKTMKMEVCFPHPKDKTADGSIYVYHDVPPEEHAGLMAAPDKGQYFADNIVRDRKSPAYKFDLVHKADPNPKAAPAPEKPKMEVTAERGIHIVDEDFLTGKQTVHPAAVDAAAKQDAAAASVPKAEILAPGTPIPQTYDELLTHTESMKARISSLIRQQGVQVQLLVTTPEAYEEMAVTFVRLSQEKKQAQAWCDADRKPHNEAYRAGLDRERKVMGGYAVLDILDKALVNYRETEKRERLAAEQRAQRLEQERLDREAEVRAAEQRRQIEDEAAVMKAVGQEEIAERILATPTTVLPQQAAPIVYAREVPKVEGLAERGTWKNEVTNKAEVALYFRDRIRMLIDDSARGVPAGQTVSDDMMNRLTLGIVAVLDDFYSLDAQKLGSFLRNKKEAAVNLVPGTRVWFEPKTSTTGR